MLLKIMGVIATLTVMLRAVVVDLVEVVKRGSTLESGGGIRGGSNPNACIGFPSEGGEVDVYSSKLHRYIPAIASDINDSSCRFTDVPKDVVVMAAKNLSGTKMNIYCTSAVIFYILLIN